MISTTNKTEPLYIVFSAVILVRISGRMDKPPNLSFNARNLLNLLRAFAWGVKALTRNAAFKAISFCPESRTAKMFAARR